MSVHTKNATIHTTAMSHTNTLHTQTSQHSAVYKGKRNFHCCRVICFV